MITGLRKRLGNALFRRQVRRRVAEARRRYPLDPILSTRPTACDRASPLKIWMLACERDTLMALWSIKSLTRHAKRSFDLCLAEDGSFTPASRRLFEYHLPGHRFFSHAESTEICKSRLRDFPLSLALRSRRKNPLPVKLFDALFLAPAERYLLMDSDVLFFRNPQLLLKLLQERPGTNHFNQERTWLNSGLAVIDKASLPLDRIEFRLAQLTPELRGRWGIEQRLHVELSQDYGVRALPVEYAVTPFSRSLPPHEQVSGHYIGIFRDLLYSDGVRRLQDSGFLERLT